MSARITPDLCKTCAFYKPAAKTCVRYVTAFSSDGKPHYGYAKSARLDNKVCGEEARLYAKWDTRHAQGGDELEY
jgi:hypothetical protein